MTTISFVNDVCTLEQAQELKKLGVKQEAFMMFNTHYKEVYSYAEYVEIMKGTLNLREYFVARFNTGELIAMLGYLDEGLCLRSTDCSGKYFGTLNKIELGCVSRNIAEIIATHLIRLLNLTILEVAEVNRRLDEFHKVK